MSKLLERELTFLNVETEPETTCEDVHDCDCCDLELDFLCDYQNYLVFYDWGYQIITVTKDEQVWQSDSISLELLIASSTTYETEEIVIALAQKFITSLIAMIPSLGQLQLELAECTH